jgi:FkbM family methyltransferase
MNEEGVTSHQLKEPVLNRIQRVGELQDYKYKQPQELIIVNLGCSWNKDDAFSFIMDHQNDIKEVHLVDAAPDAINKCKEVYEKHVNPDFFKKIHFHQLAIVADPDIDTVKILFPPDDTSSGFASTNQEIILNHYMSTTLNTREGYQQMQKTIDEGAPLEVLSTKVPCTTINRFFRQCGLNEIDRLYVDLEGLDGQVLLNLDLDYFKIPFIMYEHLHLDGYMNKRTTKNSIHKQLHEKLEEYNFHIYAYGPWNAVALNEEMDISLLTS